ncbi:hypothetical protein B0H67DRAFT_551274 [Lasiosphaeris hirsuta]|uniref:Uncharacterized protein n=1 Tax=Lasiosphaeris hirsuta TaxID=260670 RepID=A0AA40B1K9_9PEZI|nr:hypothetical protein B0H67DRAFT_551274 [Lasiosphaeris hirsuta]
MPTPRFYTGSLSPISTTLAHKHPSLACLCIFLPELEHAFLANIDPGGYECLQHITTSGCILWLTRSGPHSNQDPAFELVTGLSRTIVSELGSRYFVTLSVEGLGDISRAADNVVKDIRATTLAPSNVGLDTEFAERYGLLHIGCVIEANYVIDDISPVSPTSGSDPFEHRPACQINGWFAWSTRYTTAQPTPSGQPHERLMGWRSSCRMADAYGGPIREAEFLGMLEYHCDPALPVALRLKT